MRKLDKTAVLAASYKTWLDKLEENKEAHPPYSSKGDYYWDIVANLLWVQQGLCAYTEQFLFDHTEIKADHWKNGKYGKGRFDFFGHLEHYDESLKPEKGWLWSNLFVVDADINTKRKGSKPVKYALKPDADDYNPFYFLEYNLKEHKFLPNRERSFELQENILHDINVLGLNFQPVVQDRRAQLNTLLEEVKLGRKTLKEAKAALREYFTAFAMIVTDLKLEG